MRAVHFAATLSLGGVLAFSTLIAAPAWRATRADAAGLGDLRRPLRRLAWASLGIALVSGAAWLALEAASMSGHSILDALTGGALATTLMDTQFGGATWARLIAFVAIAAGLDLRRRGGARPAACLDAALAGFGVVAVASIAWTGHAGASEGLIGSFQLADDALHLLAAGAWLGSLIPLALLLGHARKKGDPGWATTAREATRRFSIVGIVSVATLLVTGIVNTWFLSGSIPALVGTEYGRLLLLKIGLFLAMVGVAAVNRVRLTPRLSHVPRGSKARANADALRRLARNCLIEIGLGMGVLLAVGALGTLPPGLHAEPSWPLPFRFPMEDPEAGPDIATRIGALILGLAFMAASFVLRRMVREFRGPLFATGLLLALYEIVHLAILAVPAYPTSYIASPTGYTVASVVRGRESFATHCTACHGTTGRGDGPLARTLPIEPADLTADHIYAHLDGELFWWLTAGIGDVMPGFAPALTETQRWNLIDFIHANADSVRFAAPDVAPPPYVRAPDFDVQCRDGRSLTLRQIQGQIVRVVFAGAGPADWPGKPDGVPSSATRLTTIIVGDRGAPAVARGSCATSDPDVSRAYGLYLGGGNAVPHGTEVLIDAAGSLRAWWRPGAPGEPTGDWRAPGMLAAVLDDIRREPTAPRAATSGHSHTH